MERLFLLGASGLSRCWWSRSYLQAMPENQFLLIPGFVPPTVTKGVLLQPPKTRFQKIGPNAEHRHTVSIRSIKEKLHLTTGQLVSELNAYERDHQSSNFRRRIEGQPAWRKISPVLMSSYLQGWVMQEEYMALMLKRLQNLFRFKKEQGALAPTADIRTIMDSWYKTLKIDGTDEAVSPTRLLARLVAPFYHRPVLAGVSGKFHQGSKSAGVLQCAIVTAQDEVHEFTLDAKEPLEVKHLESIKAGQVLQYAVRMQAQKVAGQTALTHDPCINHTTFYRWYSKNKMPRSVKTIELVQAAVDMVAAQMKATKK